MNILIQLGHPAHFHLYKKVAQNLTSHGHKVFVLIKKKDILEELLINAGIPYINILPEGRKDTKAGILLGMLKRFSRILIFSKRNKIDILTGSTPEVAQVARLTGKRSVVTAEDDASVVPTFVKVTAPFVDGYLSPVVCDNGKVDGISTKYESYHELAYLHPNHFTPNKAVVETYFPADKPYFIIRFSKLNAYHDDGIQGINTEIASRILSILQPHGTVYITSERELEPEFEPYRIKINPLHMHDVMAFAQMYIGDSQTMAAEAGVLGVPFVRFNGFVGRIGYLNELELKYELGYGVKTTEVDRLYEVIEQIIATPNRKELYASRRARMLSDKIDYSLFLTWFIENYPESANVMRENPDYQYRFR